MAKLSVREAAKRFDVSRPTLVKRLKSGQLSGEPVTGGGWLIDPAELVRAGYVARPEGGEVAEGVKIGLASVAGPLPAVVEAEVSALKAALKAERYAREAAEALAAERLQHIEDLRRMLPPPDASSGRAYLSLFSVSGRRRWWPF